MRTLEDGTTLMITRRQGGFRVEHIGPNGTIDAMDCDTISEARAAFHFGPARW